MVYRCHASKLGFNIFSIMTKSTITQMGESDTETRKASHRPSETEKKSDSGRERERRKTNSNFDVDGEDAEDNGTL